MMGARKDTDTMIQLYKAKHLKVRTQTYGTQIKVYRHIKNETTNKWNDPTRVS